MGIERDLIAIGLDIQNRKNKLGYKLLRTYLQNLYKQLKFMLGTILQLYYNEFAYAKEGKSIAKKSGRTLSECIQIVQEATAGYTTIRQAILQNYDPGNLFSTLSKQEEEKVEKEFENQTAPLEKATRKQTNRKSRRAD